MCTFTEAQATVKEGQGHCWSSGRNARSEGVGAALRYHSVYVIYTSLGQASHKNVKAIMTEVESIHAQPGPKCLACIDLRPSKIKF